MATGGGAGRREEDFRYTCSLCMEPYRGRTPKILPCFHTFCLPCLTALQASVVIATPADCADNVKQLPEGEDQSVETPTHTQEKETTQTSPGQEVAADVTPCANDVMTSGGEAGKAVFLCPTCRAPVCVPDGGVAALQSNFYLQQEESGEQAPPPVLCDMCDEANQQHAAHVCQQCSLRMCRHCRRCHDRLMRHHHVTSLSLDQPLAARMEKKGVCLVHQDQRLCFHCQQCDVSICLHCKLTSHEGHVTVDLISVAAQAKKEVTSLVTTAQEQLQVVESCLRRMERDERELTRHAQEVTQQIHARYDVIMARMQRSRDELLEEVKAKEEEVRGQLRAQKSAATVTMETLSAVVSRAAGVSGSDPDVVVVRKEVQAALLSEDQLDQHRQAAARQQCLWSWRYDLRDVSLLQQDGVEGCMGRVVEGGDDDVTRPLTLTQLADKLDALVTRLDSSQDDVTALKGSEDDIKKSMTALSDDVKKSMTVLSDDVTALKSGEADVKKTITALLDDVKKTMTALSDDVTVLKSSGDDIKKTTSSLAGDVKTLKMTTSGLQETVGKVGKTIVFHAKYIDTAKTKPYKPIVFSTVSVNEGGCYDNTTGVFTTSVPGTYVITATVESDKEDNSVEAWIKVDDESYARLKGSYSSTGSSSVSVQLGVGQRVWVRAGSDADLYYDDGMVFTGALVTPKLDN